MSGAVEKVPKSGNTIPILLHRMAPDRDGQAHCAIAVRDVAARYLFNYDFPFSISAKIENRKL